MHGALTYGDGSIFSRSTVLHDLGRDFPEGRSTVLDDLVIYVRRRRLEIERILIHNHFIFIEFTL